MGVMRNVHKILGGKPEGMIILKLFLKKQGVKMLTGST
jgi:hypothetical protein